MTTRSSTVQDPAAAAPPQDPPTSNHNKALDGTMTPPFVTAGMERKIGLLEHRFHEPSSSGVVPEGSNYAGNHGSNQGSNQGGIRSFGFVKGSVQEEDKMQGNGASLVPRNSLSALSASSALVCTSHLSGSFVGGSNSNPAGSGTGSNQTLITSHAKKLSKTSVIVTETPPDVSSVDVDKNASPARNTRAGAAKRLRLAPGASPAVGVGSRNEGQTSGRKKALPSKDALPSITECTPTRTPQGAVGSTSTRRSRKRNRLGFTTPGNNNPSASDMNESSSVTQQIQQEPPVRQSLDASEATCASRDRAGSSNSTAPATPVTTKKKCAPPPNNKCIRDFFGTKKTGTTSSSKATNQNNNNAPSTPSPGVTTRRRLLVAGQPISAESSALSSNSTLSTDKNSAKELERLRAQCQHLEKEIKDRDDKLSAVANNQSILHNMLKSTLAQREEELINLKKDADERAAMSIKSIEQLIRAENAREQKDLRDRLASDASRLGRLVYTRAGMHSVESWEDGHAAKALRKRRNDLNAKRRELEERQRVAMRAAKRVRQEVDKGGIEVAGVEESSRDTLSGGLPVMDRLEAMEAEESVRLHLSNLQKQEDELTEEEVALQSEKNAHIRALKRVAGEDSSRFRSRPKLHGRYIPLNLLGKGGFSEVWRAYDLVELREVAVKIHQLDPQWSEAKMENYTKHVSREYEIHRDVRHPRIVSLYDVFEIDTNSFATVLECCKGTDLDSLLKQKKVLPERDARAILLQILCGMRYLSSPSDDGSRQGIIHYDLKPGNILFDSNGDAKITDFGLSKIVDGGDPADSMELTSQGAGTYWYLPPECFMTHHNVRISNKVDVWSIGVIYYQMLFGKRPFGDGQTQEKVLTHHIMLNAREVRFPPKSDVSEEGKQFIRKMLTYDQTLRPNISQLCESSYLLHTKL